MTSLSSGALLSAQQPTEALRCPDHSLVRNSLRTCTLASGHSLLRAARLRHSVANINATHGRSHRRGTDALAATTQQSSAVMTPILQLQKRLQDSGAVLDALDLSYKQSVAARKVRQGEVLLSIPGDVAVTKEDVAAEPACAQLASGRSEVVGLALWLIVQRCKGSTSPWKDFVDTLPQTTNSPTLWPPEEQSEYLQGSPALQEAQARSTALDAEWDSVSQQMAADPSQQADLKINRDIFRSAVAVVIAHAVYLPSVQCFSLLPVASTLQRTGADTGAALDYDIDNGCVTLTAQRTIRQGEPVAIYDGRPNSEMFLASGMLEENNLSDYLTVQASLVAADKLYVMKKQVVQSLGFDVQQEFPIYADRMPTQLLAFLRLSRLQDSGQMAKINFEDDVVISQSNEYEVLQLLMADMRDRLTAYPGSIEDEMKLLQNKKLTERQRAAAQLRFSEKVILQKTLDAVRRRLAPIRGIPTKGGKMVSPNADLEDIFSTIENIPNAPKKLFAGIKSWARGDKDPTWKR
ncbi:TPA: hypothetical protein ACH3X2_013468 [Trebouxia sp. C0005]|nr:MAG: ribulose-1 [Trebouxia sp. A1-2]